MDQVPSVRETTGDRITTHRDLANAAQRLFSADFVAVQAVNPITQRLYSDAIITGKLPGNHPQDLVQTHIKSLTDRVRKQKGLYLKRQSPGSNEKQEVTPFADLSTIAAIALNTKRERTPMAVLVLGFRKRRRLKKVEIDLLKLFTNQWLPVLENVWLLGRYREVIKVSQEINQTIKQPRELFEQLLENVSSILDTRYFFMLAVYHQSNQSIDYHYSYRGKIEHLEPRQLEPHSAADRSFDSGCAYVIETKESFVEFERSKNFNSQIEFVPHHGSEEADPESLIFVPLIFRDEPLGLLSVQQLHPNAFDNEDVRIMTLLGNQVALAINNFKLFGYLKDLNEAEQQLTSELSSDGMLDSVVDRIRMATEAHIVTLYPYIQDNPLEERFAEPHLSGELLAPFNSRTSVREDDIVWLSLQKEEVWASDSSLLFDQVSAGAHSRKGNFGVRERIASTAVLTLRIEGEAVGVLFINYRHPQRFEEAQQNFIRGLASFAAIAINNNRRFRGLSRHRLEELELLRQIDLQVSGSINLQEVLQVILKSAAEFVGGDDAAIFLYNRHTNHLETEVSFGHGAEQYRNFSLPVEGKGLIPWVYRAGKPVRINDVRTEPGLRDVYYQLRPETSSELDVPLKDGDEVVGVITFESSKPDAFSQAHEEFLVTLAGQAVLEIKKAQIYERAEERRRNLESLQEITKEIIAQRGDPAMVIEFILSKARTLIDAEGGLFQLYDGTVPGRHFVDANDELTKQVLSQRHELGVELGIVSRVAETRFPYTTIGTDAQDDPFYTGSQSIHSVSAVPLLTEGELIGVLDLESPRKFAFDAEDERALVLFGELAVIAIKNARDYARAEDESKHAKDEWKRFQLLWRAGSELAEIIDPAQLKSAYDIVIAKIGEFSEGEVVIRRYDPMTEELIWAAVGRARAAEPLPSIRKNEGINGQVARELRTIILHDLDSLPPEIAAPVADDPSIKTLLITPLLFRTSYYGNLALSDVVPHSIDHADVILVEGLATQLAITMHRLETVKARLEAEQKAASLTFMSEAGQSVMGLAHRLGNQLGPVRVYADILREMLEEKGIHDPALLENLNRIVAIVTSVLTMATGLRNSIHSFGVSASTDLIWSEVPLESLVDEALRVVPTPETVHITKEIPNDLGLLRVRPPQVIDILHNLVTNSIEAMPEGGEISIRASLNNGASGSASPFVRIEVEDTGPGIPVSEQAKIFNLFYSTKQSSGFGLWSSRQYARENGGDLTYEPRTSGGARFVLHLPRVQQEAGDSGGIKVASSSAPQALLAEDDGDWRAIIKPLLEKAGFKTVTAETLSQAKTLLSSRHFDLLILDLSFELGNATNRNGLNLLEDLEKSGLSQPANIIMISAYGSGDVIRKAFGDHRVSDFLDKYDFDPHEFSKIVNEIFADVTGKNTPGARRALK